MNTDAVPTTVPETSSQPLNFEKVASQLFSNDYFFAFIVIIVVAYSHNATPKFTTTMTKFMSYDVIRVLSLALLLIIHKSRPTVAIILALVFVYLLQFLYDESINKSIKKFINSQVVTDPTVTVTDPPTVTVTDPPTVTVTNPT